MGELIIIIGFVQGIITKQLIIEFSIGASSCFDIQLVYNLRL